MSSFQARQDAWVVLTEVAQPRLVELAQERLAALEELEKQHPTTKLEQLETAERITAARANLDRIQLASQMLAERAP